MGRSEVKTWISAYAIALSYTIYMVLTTGVRARTDASFNLNGVTSAFKTGHLGVGYPSGSSYGSLQTILLRITGLSIWDTNWTSPILAVTLLSLIGLITISLTRRVTGFTPWWAPPIVILLLVTSPDIFAPYRETSHKALTYSYLIFTVYLLHLYMGENINQKSLEFLILLFMVTLLLSNYIWSTIAIFWICLALFFINIRNTHMILTVIAMNISLILYYSNITIRQVFVRGFEVIYAIQIAFASSNSNSKVSSGGETEGLISLMANYPEVSIFGISISLFFFVSLASITSGLLTGMAFFLTIWILWKTNDRSQLAIHHLFFTATITYGLLFVLAAVAGVGVFAKRIVRPAVIIGLPLWVLTITADEIPQFLKHNREIIIAVVLAVIIISAPLSSLRIASDNTGQSSDVWADSQEISASEWVDQYSTNKSHFASNKQLVHYISAKYYRDSVYLSRGKCYDPLVYSSRGRQSITLYKIGYTPYDIASEIGSSCPSPLAIN